MKSLIKIASGLTFLVLFSSCWVYQHVSLQGNAPQNDKSEFVIENDSIAILYSFYGEGGPITINISNKLNQPLYVDWRKSALIINGQSFTLWKDQASLSAYTSSYSVMQDDQVTHISGNIEGSIVKNDKVSFIPPHAKIVINSYSLYNGLFNTPDQAGEKIKFFTADGYKRKATKYAFSEQTSPFNFRIFLSVSLDDNFKSPFQFDNNFWVSEYFTTTADPSALDIYFGNQFYNTK